MSSRNRDSLAISLDVECVLAHSVKRLIEVHNRQYGTKYTVDEIDSWEWIPDHIGDEEFRKIVREEWVKRPEMIEVCEPNLAEAVNRLTTIAKVDIVTSHVGVEEEMQSWLIDQGIDGYERFVSTEETKAALGYDVYIDDKPNLADELQEDQEQYLLQWGWNRGYWDHPSAIPVNSVTEAVDSIEERY